MKRPVVGIVTFPIEESGYHPLVNLIDAVTPSCQAVCVITGGAGLRLTGQYGLTVKKVSHNPGKGRMKRVLGYLHTQVKISKRIVESRREVDEFIFFFGGDMLSLPIMTAKVLGKRVYLNLAGSSAETLQASGSMLFAVANGLFRMNCLLSDTIVVYSNRLISQWHLQRHRTKIANAPTHTVDASFLKITTEYSKKPDVVSFIGRLSPEKGVLNFVQCMPLVLRKKPALRFAIVGDGPLSKEINRRLRESNLEDKVIRPGWVDHSKIANWLNSSCLLVVPSYTEGLPNIMLEAMACGTPVLATPVGGVQDLIEDERTGFLTATNNPEEIAKNIIRALDSSIIETIIGNARKTADEYTLEKAVSRWENIIEGINEE